MASEGTPSILLPITVNLKYIVKLIRNEMNQLILLDQFLTYFIGDDSDISLSVAIHFFQEKEVTLD